MPRIALKDRMQELAARGELTARNADRHWLYEQSVQNASFEVEFIDRVFAKEYGRRPTDFREDFCGTALLCAEWVGRRRTNAAMGVDLDGPTLAWGRRHNLAPLGQRAGAVVLIQDDVRNVTRPACDVLAATNFSWWGLKTRPALKEYLQGALRSLRPQGMLVLDCFGGPEAQIPQLEERQVYGFQYFWDQDAFNPITHDLRCLIHFGFPDGSRLNRAFRYDWRLWSLPETCDILAECGFRKTLVYWEGAGRDGEPNGVFRPSRKGDLAPAWVAYIVAFR